MSKKAKSADPVGDDPLLLVYVLSGNVVAIAGVLISTGILGWQVFGWLKSGDWTPLPLASLGLREAAEFLEHQELRNWAVNPSNWIGLHKFLDWLNVAVAPILIGMLLARVFGLWRWQSWVWLMLLRFYTLCQAKKSPEP